jgi:Ca2+-binding RTX toxin-like protein
VLFQDGYVAFDTDGVAGQAYRLYQAAFGQVSDLANLGDTIYQIDQGLALNAAAGTLLGSAAFLNANGSSLSSADFITLVYGNALGRAPDAGESTLWLSRLSSGTAREQLVVALSESNEGNAYVASRIANGIEYTPYAPAPTYFQTNFGPLAALTYKGPVEFLEFQMLGSSDGDIVTGSDGNDFINLLGGDDAADGGAGQDVLDGGVGSNFLTGGLFTISITSGFSLFTMTCSIGFVTLTTSLYC